MAPRKDLSPRVQQDESVDFFELEAGERDEAVEVEQKRDLYRGAELNEYVDRDGVVQFKSITLPNRGITDYPLTINDNKTFSASDKSRVSVKGEVDLKGQKNHMVSKIAAT